MLGAQAVDPVHADELGWWFWDDIRVFRQGPFATEDEARLQMADYYMLADRSIRNMRDPRR